MSSEILDCRSHSCYFAVDRTGQRNNGPCRCLPDLSPPVRTQIRMTFLAKLNHEREKFARIAAAKRSYSPMPNPSDLDLGWKRCAAAIEKEIRES